MSPHENAAERPPKRQKLEDVPVPEPIEDNQKVVDAPHHPAVAAAVQAEPAKDAGRGDVAKEQKAGITSYINANAPGFTGTVKARYTDFLVNEITLDGQVLHLSNLSVPKLQQDSIAEGEAAEPVSQPVKAEHGTANDTANPPAEKQETEKQPDEPSVISPEDIAALEGAFGERTTKAMVRLSNAVLKNPERKAREFDPFHSDPIEDKEQRTTAHQLVRRVFSGRLETRTESDNTFKVSASSPQSRQPKDLNRAAGGPNKAKQGRLAWEQLGGDFLHFTLYKENKDTMEAVGFLGTQTKLGSKKFGFAGTKDKRGVTVQRVSVHRARAENLAPVGKKLFNCKIGDFSYEKSGLTLGDLAGNEFVITLRDCHFHGEEGLGIGERLELGNRILSTSVNDFQTKGFINYYGLQRFGSFANGTDAIGVAMLRGDLEGAVKQILAYSPSTLAAALDPESTALISSDDKARAKAIHLWEKDGRSHEALGVLPRKFGAESAIIKHLGWEERGTKALKSAKDWQGALSAIPRNLRLMYVHAYQSLVWNTVASRRWEIFGDRVIEGDLVLVHEHKHKQQAAQPVEEFDADGEVIIMPQGEDSARGADDKFERARALTAAEVASGQYNIFDIVLPQPGFDVEYPRNEIGTLYKEFMGSERGGGLDPNNMRRKWKDISLSGGYRKLLAKPGPGVSYEVKEYSRDAEQLVETDMDRLIKDNKTKPFNDKPRDEAMEDAPAEDAKKVAVVLRMKLGSSTYATMALRELMKEGGAKAFQPEYNTGR